MADKPKQNSKQRDLKRFLADLELQWRNFKALEKLHKKGKTPKQGSR